MGLCWESYNLSIRLKHGLNGISSGKEQVLVLVVSPVYGYERHVLENNLFKPVGRNRAGDHEIHDVRVHAETSEESDEDGCEEKDRPDRVEWNIEHVWQDLVQVEEHE